MSDPEDPNAGGLDDALQREIDEALDGRSIEELLDETAPPPSRTADDAGEIGPGQVRQGVVASVDNQFILVEFGGKDQGMAASEQFEELPEVGDQIELAVVRYDRNEDLWILSRQGAVEKTTWEDLVEGQIVDAFVEKSNKGGLEVKFSGIKAFMPISQISMYRVEELDEFINTKLRCQVIEVDRHDKRVIVSARAVLELEAQEKREKLMAELAEGDVREGVVRQIMPFGVFVDIGGADGLVHVSQMSYARVEDPADMVQPGQTVRVQVLKIDEETGKISLGMKQLAPDPWDGVEGKYPAGSLVTGQITSLQNFGAFCRIEDGLEALVPISEITWTGRLNHPSQVLRAGETVQALVLSVDPEAKRMALSIKQAQASPWSGAADRYPPDSHQVGRVTRIAEFGAFVELETGVEGLVHVSELSHEHIRRPEDVVQVGQDVGVRVLDVDEAGRRISLSIKAAADAAESADAAPAEAPKPKKRKHPLRGGLD